MKISSIAFLAMIFSGAQASMAVSMPNPASKLCIDLGGSLQMYNTVEGGGIGLCAFNDGTNLNGLIEEWTLFRFKQNSAAPSQAVKAFSDHVTYDAPAGPAGHPAKQYCHQIGGTDHNIVDSSGAESGVCEFQDGSQIEEWTLFRGPEVHKSLAKALQ